MTLKTDFADDPNVDGVLNTTCSVPLPMPKDGSEGTPLRCMLKKLIPAL